MGNFNLCKSTEKVRERVLLSLQNIYIPIKVNFSKILFCFWSGNQVSAFAMVRKCLRDRELKQHIKGNIEKVKQMVSQELCLCSSSPFLKVLLLYQIIFNKLLLYSIMLILVMFLSSTAVLQSCFYPFHFRYGKTEEKRNIVIFFQSSNQ